METLDQHSMGAVQNKIPKEPSSLELQINFAQNQHDQICKITSFLNTEVVTRLDALANRLNSSDYPKNHKEVAPKSNNNEQNKPSPPPNGLVGDLITVNKINADALSTIQNQVFNDIVEAIYYLEKHI